MDNRPWTKYWIRVFNQDIKYGHKRFKILDAVYPNFEIDEQIMDTVNLSDFISIEENRLALFIGTQFGIYPRINNIPGFFNGKKLIAILGKSMLSGHVAGLSIYQIEEDDRCKLSNNSGQIDT